MYVCVLGNAVKVMCVAFYLRLLLLNVEVLRIAYGEHTKL